MSDAANIFSSRPFIGCYRLQEQFPVQENGRQRAIYWYGEGVMNITYSPGQTAVQEWFKGKLLKKTSHADFEGALFHHYRSYDSLRDKVFLGWMRKLEALPGIYVEPFTTGSKGYLFFPAVFLFYLRVPVTRFNYEKLSKAIWYNGLQKRVHHRYKTSLYKKVKGTEWTKDDIELVEFSLVWYEVYPFCQLLVAAGHIDPGCGVPVIVQEYNSGTVCKGIQFYGKEEDTLKVLFKEKEQE